MVFHSFKSTYYVENKSKNKILTLSSLVSPTMIQDSSNSSEKRPSITAEELTPIVLNQLQTATKLR